MTSENDGAPRILVMDGNERNADLLAEFLTERGYTPAVATDLDGAEDRLSDAESYAFAIVDIDRFDSPVWPYCDRLEDHDVPFVVLSGISDRSLRRKCRDRGADAFVEKPIPKRTLRELIRSALGF